MLSLPVCESFNLGCPDVLACLKLLVSAFELGECLLHVQFRLVLFCFEGVLTWRAEQLLKSVSLSVRAKDAELAPDVLALQEKERVQYALCFSDQLVAVDAPDAEQVQERYKVAMATVQLPDERLTPSFGCSVDSFELSAVGCCRCLTTSRSSSAHWCLAGFSNFGGRADKYLPPLPLINHGEMKQGRIRELEEVPQVSRSAVELASSD